MFDEIILIQRNGYIFQVNLAHPNWRYKGGGSGTTTKTVTDNKTTRQKQEIESMFDVYSPYVGQGTEVYEGERVAPFSTLQNQAISGAGNYASYFSTPQAVGTPLNAETGAATKDLLVGKTGAQKMGAPEIESYFTDTLYDPTMRRLREDVLPMVDESFSGPGFWGSSRSHARQDAATDTRDLLAGQWADLNWNLQQQNQAIDEAKAGRSLAALGPAMAYGNTEYQNAMQNLEVAAGKIQGLSQLFGFGSEERSLEQQNLAASFAKWLEAEQITDPEVLNVMLALIGQSISGTGREEVTPNVWHSEDWAQNVFAPAGIGMFGF